MTIAELIEHLKTLPGHATVHVPIVTSTGWDGSHSGYVSLTKELLDFTEYKDSPWLEIGEVI